MPKGLTIKYDHLPELAAELKTLAKTSVDVGVPAEKAKRKDEKGTANNAMLAYVHDNGYPALNIPARPFMNEGINDKRDDITTYLAQAGDAVLEGRDANQALHAVGLAAQNGIRARINSNIPPPLKQGTIKARQRRGVTRTNTLIDTGKMRNAISYVINKGRK